MTPTELVFASLERLATRHPRHALEAMWAVLDAHRAGREDLARCIAEATADADSLSKYADASNECGPGFPRDDPGPWHWCGLASLTRAATLAATDPERALRYVDTAAFEITYPSRELQNTERAWRAARGG